MSEEQRPWEPRIDGFIEWFRERPQLKITTGELAEGGEDLGDPDADSPHRLADHELPHCVAGWMGCYAIEQGWIVALPEDHPCYLPVQATDIMEAFAIPVHICSEVYDQIFNMNDQAGWTDGVATGETVRELMVPLLEKIRDSDLVELARIEEIEQRYRDIPPKTAVPPRPPLAT